MSIPDSHFSLLSEAISSGAVTIFYGAGINYAQYPAGRNWIPTENYLPTGAELSSYLAREYQESDFANCLQAKDSIAQHLSSITDPVISSEQNKNLGTLADKSIPDLTRSSEYAATMESAPVPLNQSLHNIFSKETPVTDMHHWLATLPGKVTKSNRQPIFITTNYDLLLERALVEKGVPFDVLFYREPYGNSADWLCHWKNAHIYYTDSSKGCAGWDTPVFPFKDYADLAVGSDDPPFPVGSSATPARAIILKIHGTVSPHTSADSSFVITHSDYVSFLRRVPSGKFLPDSLYKRIIKTHFLFIGYGLGDTNILALCQNLWNDRTSKHWKNWALQHFVSDYDRRRWEANSVDSYQTSLADYYNELNKKNI